MPFLTGYRVDILCLAFVAPYVFEIGLALGQIALHADFESVSLDMDNSVVDGTDIFLEWLRSWTAVPWRAPVYCRVSGVDGKRPVFNVDRSSSWADLSEHPQLRPTDLASI